VGCSKLNKLTMAPMMNDHADLASNDKPKPKLFYGVRKCESLEGPAIFLNWTDCKFFVGSEKDDNIEFQSFERLADAATYVTFQQEAAVYDVPAIDREQLQAKLQDYDDNDDRQERLARLKEIADEAPKPDNVSEDSSSESPNAGGELPDSRGKSTEDFPIVVSDGGGGGVAWKRS
jgi:hypothetical protein